VIEHLATLAAAIAALFIIRDIALKLAERYAAKPVVERMATLEAAFEAFAKEARAALIAQEKRMDELRAPQNHKAAALIAGGIPRSIAR
jgi:hypothetical protein